MLIFLFNVAGYYVVYLGWRFQAKTEMTQRLDDEKYSSDETVTIKLPYSLPYQDEDTDYKRVQGEFQHNGEFFKLVKQKIQNDTLYVVCIKDHKEKKIFNFMADMAKASTDNSPVNSPLSKLLNTLIKDYVSGEVIIPVSQQNGWTSILNFIKPQFQLLSKHNVYFSPPPDAIV